MPEVFGWAFDCNQKISISSVSVPVRCVNSQVDIYHKWKWYKSRHTGFPKLWTANLTFFRPVTSSTKPWYTACCNKRTYDKFMLTVMSQRLCTFFSRRVVRWETSTCCFVDWHIPFLPSLSLHFDFGTAYRNACVALVDEKALLARNIASESIQALLYATTTTLEELQLVFTIEGAFKTEYPADWKYFARGRVRQIAISGNPRGFR